MKEIILQKIIDITSSKNIPLITKSKSNTCDPYSIKYPIPDFEVKNSPVIVPIKHIDIFILKVLLIVFLLLGITREVRMSFLLALNVFKSFIFILSVFLNPLYIASILTIIDIKTLIVIILDVNNKAVYTYGLRVTDIKKQMKRNAIKDGYMEDFMEDYTK